MTHTANTPAASADTLHEAGEIRVKLCERIYNDTAAPVAIGDTVIYNKFKGETQRRAVITGYDDTIKLYFLDTEDGQHFAIGRDGFAVCGPKSSTEEPAALYVLSFTTCPDVADTPANADKFTTHYSNDRRALFALLMSLQTSGTPLYHATIKTA